MLEFVSCNHFRLHGHIDMQESSDLLNELLVLPRSLLKLQSSNERSSKESGDLLLDIGALESSDSLLLAALLDLQRNISKNGGRLRVVGLSDSMLGLARVYGIDSLLETVLEV
jgi:ABC-type transporter Mla MlaB component